MVESQNVELCKSAHEKSATESLLCLNELVKYTQVLFLLKWKKRLTKG